MMADNNIIIDLRVQEDLETNLGKLQILNAEIAIILDEIKNGLNEKKNISEPRNDKPQIRHLNLLEDPIQLNINLKCKTFLFVFRQFISKYFRALYQSKEILGYEKVANVLPDLSVNGSTKKIINLLKGTYDFDKDIINTIQEGGDFLIISRLLRNSIKTYAVLITHTVYDGENANFYLNFPMDKETKDDTLLFVKEKLIKMDETSNFTVKVGFFDNCQLYANKLFEILIDKLDNKGVFDNQGNSQNK
ncbi:hypothetical protein [Acidiluteibacter ferrifornacis]|nr:hypothetical protein [Acidiluteibacter ferrifornacis]